MSVERWLNFKLGIGLSAIVIVVSFMIFVAINSSFYSKSNVLYIKSFENRAEMYGFKIIMGNVESPTYTVEAGDAETFLGYARIFSTNKSIIKDGYNRFWVFENRDGLIIGYCIDISIEQYLGDEPYHFWDREEYEEDFYVLPQIEQTSFVVEYFNWTIGE